MRVISVWTPAGGKEAAAALAGVAVACNTADLRLPSSGTDGGSSAPSGDPTEVALLEMAVSRGVDVTLAGREARRRAMFRFDPRLALMTTVDELDGVPVISVKGAPEAIMTHVNRLMGQAGERPITDADRARVTGIMESYGRQGLRVLAFARRTLSVTAPIPATREEAEQDLCLLGVTAMQDPPRAEVRAAIAQVHRAASGCTWSPGTTG